MTKIGVFILLLGFLAAIPALKADALPDKECQASIENLLTKQSEVYGVDLLALFKNNDKEVKDAETNEHKLVRPIGFANKYDGEFDSYFPEKKTKDVKKVVKANEKFRLKAISNCKNDMIRRGKGQAGSKECETFAFANQPIASVTVQKVSGSRSGVFDTSWPTYTVTVAGTQLQAKGVNTLQFFFDVSTKGCPVGGVQKGVYPPSDAMNAVTAKIDLCLNGKVNLAHLTSYPDSDRAYGAPIDPAACRKDLAIPAQTICHEKTKKSWGDCKQKDNWGPYLDDAAKYCDKVQANYTKWLESTDALCKEYKDDIAKVKAKRDELDPGRKGNPNAADNAQESFY